MSDRSEQALRERLELARKATDGPWKESVQIVNGDAVSAVVSRIFRTFFEAV